MLVPVSAFPDFPESPLSPCFQDSQGWLGILATQERFLGYAIPVPSCRLTDFKMPRRVLKNRNLIQPKLGLCAVVGRHRVGPSPCFLQSPQGNTLASSHSRITSIPMILTRNVRFSASIHLCLPLAGLRFLEVRENLSFISISTVLSV